MSIVYFIQQGTDGPIKIGITTNLDNRLRTFQTASPVRLRVLRTEPGGRKRELQLHRRFRSHRMEGEWFQPQPVLAYIHAAPVTGLDVRRRGKAFARGLREVLSWLLVPVGGLLVMLDSLLPRKRRRKRQRWPRALATLTAAATGALYYIGHNDWWMLAAPITVAATIAGMTRRAR